MANSEELTAEQLLNYVRIANLPFGISANQITAYFDQFGIIVKLHLKRRVNKNSSTLLPRPNVTLIFSDSDSVDQIMAARPIYLDDCKLFIRRCLPLSTKYPKEAYLTVKKILVRTKTENIDDILPSDELIVDYLSAAGGKIDYYEKLDQKTVLVQFEDYDTVDVCCLSRPHYIGNQAIEIEKCTDEDTTRYCIETQQKSNSGSDHYSPTIDTDIGMVDTLSSTPILSIEDQIIQLRASYNDRTNRLEYEHEQLIDSLSAEWEQTAKERVRLQRLTLDYKQESERLEKETRQWQKLYSDSLKEKPTVKAEGDNKLSEAYHKNVIAKEKYDQLIRNIQQ